MNWIEIVHRWRRLPAEEKLRRRWQAIPLDVAQSMAFEGEPVDRRWLEELHSQTATPALSKPLAASFPIPIQP